MLSQWRESQRRTRLSRNNAKSTKIKVSALYILALWVELVTRAVYAGCSGYTGGNSVDSHTELSLRQQIQKFADHSSSADSIAVGRLRRERDELKNAVTTFEAELMEIQAEASTLAEDRDNFKLLYEQVSRLFWAKCLPGSTSHDIHCTGQ